MRLSSLVATALLVVALLSGTAAAVENEPPLADAGLDQTVTTNTTVYLDANGSRDPDGTVARVSWTVETPEGDTVSPDCRTCRQTRFRPATAGHYNVTVTVTDDDGAARSDTLHVVVSATTGPTVSLTGPATVSRGDAASFTADVASTGPALSTLAWAVEGNVTDRTSVTGEDASVNTSHTFGSTGTRLLRVVAYDALGRRGTATKRVVVVGGSVSRPASNSGNSGGGDSACHFWENDCLTDVVLTNPMTGEKKIIEGDGESGTTIWVEGKPRDINELLGSDLSEYENPDGTLDYDAVMDDAVPAANQQDLGMDPGTDSSDDFSKSDENSVISNDYTYDGGSATDHYGGGSGSSGSSDASSSGIDHSDTTSDSGHTITRGSSGGSSATGSDDSSGGDSGGASSSGLFSGGTGSSDLGHDSIDSGSSDSDGYSGGSPSDHYSSSGDSSDSGGGGDGSGCQYPSYPSLCG